jgi:cytochrome P450
MTAHAGTGTVTTNAEAPGAPGRLPIAGHILKWRKDPVALLADAARRGDVIRLGLPGDTFLITHPRHVKHVLQDNNQNYVKGWVFDRIRPYWGESLLTAEGEVWRQQRRRVQPSFKREHTHGFAPIVTVRTAEMLARWESAASTRRELALYNEMTELALVIIGDVLFGVDLWTDAAEMARAAQSALAVLKTRVGCCSRVTTPSASPSRGPGICSRCTRRSNAGFTSRSPRSSAIAFRPWRISRDSDTQRWFCRSPCGCIRRSG